MFRLKQGGKGSWSSVQKGERWGGAGSMEPLGHDVRTTVRTFIYPEGMEAL